MKNILYIAVILVGGVACNKKLNTSISQQILDAKGTYTSNAKVSLLVSGGEISTYQTVILNGVSFDFTTTGDQIKYIQTKDPKFVTKEGYHVGQKLSELPATFKQSLVKEPGWAYYKPIGANWNLAFCEGKSCTDESPADNWEVAWIFSRNNN